MLNIDKKVMGIFVFCALCLFLKDSYAVGLPLLDQSKIRVTVAPGETKYGEINMENPENQGKIMRVYLEDWRYSSAGDGSKEFLSPGTLENSCASWISFSPAEFEINPFGRQKLGYSIKAPKDAKGAYYAAMFFESSTEDTGIKKEGFAAGLSLAIRVATLFYVEVEGTVKRTGEFTNLKVVSDDSGKLKIGLDFANTGTTDITCGGTYHIMDKEGMILARGEFKSIYTFAKETGKLSAEWAKPLPKGSYGLVLTLNLGKALEEVHIGRGPIVTKESTIDIGDNGQVIKVGRLE